MVLGGFGGNELLWVVMGWTRGVLGGYWWLWLVIDGYGWLWCGTGWLSLVISGFDLLGLLRPSP